jgi:hypothetical protein
MTQHYGSIVGMSYGVKVVDCFYDNQMSIIGWIDNTDATGKAEGLPTDTLTTQDFSFNSSFAN